MVSKKTIYTYILAFSFLALVFAIILALDIIDRRSIVESESNIINNNNNNGTDSSSEISTKVKNGIEARNQANYKKALELHFEAHEKAKKSNDTIRQIIALNNIGTDLRRVASNTEASKYYYDALELASNKEEYNKVKSYTYNGLGNIFLSLSKNKIARQYFRKSLHISETQNNILGQAINYANIAETFDREENIDSIFFYYNKSLVHNKKINSPVGISICKKALGDLNISIGDTIKGLNLIYEAYDLLKDSKDLFHKFEVEKGVCDALIKTNRLDEAELIINELSKTSEIIGSFEYKYETYELTSKLKEKQHKFQEAFYAKKTASLYHDSILTENNEISLLEFEKQQEIKQAVESIRLLTYKTNFIEKTKNIQRSIFVLFTIGFLYLIGILYLRFLNKKKISSELKKINEMKSCFFGNISHEFRTPLTLIKSPIEKWLAEDINPKLKADLEIMHRNSTRLLFLVEQLLNLSKIDAGSFKISYKLADLSIQIRGISQEYKHLAREKLINYEININDSGTFEFDPNIIEIILTNLLSNAFKYTPTRGTINITGNKEESYYRISVVNSGNILNEEDLNNIFERFYTSQISNNSGTGIGLALVKELSILHKAEIEVRNNKPNKIEFISRIPIIAPKKAENDDTILDVHINNEAINGHSNGLYKIENTNGKLNLCDSEDSKPLLLIVEDNKDMRDYIANSFEDIFKVIKAKDGIEGLNMARTHIPDIIISDIMMQFMDGIELCNAIKEDCHTNHIPVILLTALAEEEAMLRGLANKADDYVTKPFSIKMLIHKALNLINIRKSLSDKYREEIIIIPLNTLIKNGGSCFNDTLKDILTNDITNPDFGIEQFCKKTSMSRSQLYRKIKAVSGMSVSEFIRIHRIKIASELLKNEDLNVSDVCYASGFSDASYFSKSFKETYGVTPLEYKKAQAK